MFLCTSSCRDPPEKLVLKTLNCIYRLEAKIKDFETQILKVILDFTESQFIIFKNIVHSESYLQKIRHEI